MGIFRNIITYFLGNQSSNNSNSELLNMGQQLLKDKVVDIGDKLDEGVNSAKVNLENAYKRLNPINQDKYPEFKSNEKAFISKEGILWFTRRDLEAARFYYSGGKEGYVVSDRVQSNGPAQLTPPFIKLKQDIENAEKKVREIEQAKGYEFVKCLDNNIIFRQIETQRELSAEESNKI